MKTHPLKNYHKLAILCSLIAAIILAMAAWSRQASKNLMPLAAQEWEVLEKGAVYRLYFNQNDTLLAVSSTNAPVQVWETTSETLRSTLESSTETRSTLQFAPDNSTIAAINRDNNLQVWNSENGRLIHTHENPAKIVELAFETKNTESDTVYLLGEQGIVYTYNYISHTIYSQKILDGFIDKISSAYINPNVMRAVAYTETGRIVVWDIQSGKTVFAIEKQFSVEPGLLLDSNGEHLLIEGPSYEQSDIQVWSITKGALLQTIQLPGARTARATFHPENKILALADVFIHDDITNIQPPRVQLWRTTKDEYTLTKTIQHSTVYDDIVFSPTGSLLALIDQLGTIRIWKAKDLL